MNRPKLPSAAALVAALSFIAGCNCGGQGNPSLDGGSGGGGDSGATGGGSPTGGVSATGGGNPTGGGSMNVGGGSEGGGAATGGGGGGTGGAGHIAVPWLGTRQWGALGAGTYGYGVATDPSGNIFVAGNGYGALDDGGTIGSPDTFVIKLDATGSTIWSRRLGPVSFRRSFPTVAPRWPTGGGSPPTRVGPSSGSVSSARPA